ncbi:porin, Gram-negative type [Rhodoferax ferrireducens T118]|uniref:Porin, Gram-negative type n=1 Tax=Albidiferax ferrireducens (strain ATCC BAA-621 / DSM 15236 / T118) TaxID=338969 RepID=Q221M4_ALBFT|nr:porin [Rhodoferax ferrireducens]ABD68279.1 porin, Gram-negative type [Rhodoferax ferrireducens T118]
MKKSLIALAVLAASGAAMAQSSVTLYGVADVGFAHEDNGSTSVNRMDSGNLNGSRWGLKGSEDLGGGLKAIFTLEAGFSLDTGAQADAASFFNRQSFVGVSSNFGTVKLGRQMNPVYATASTWDSFGDALAGDSSHLFSYNGSRTNNMISYNYSANGFYGELQYGLGEVAGNNSITGDNSAGRSAAMFVGYMRGPFDVVLTHQNIHNSGPYTTATKMTLLGGNYDFGVVKLFAAYAVEKTLGVGAKDQKDAHLGLTAPVGTAGTVELSYLRKKDDLVSNANAHQVAVGYVHTLSKRTALYTSYAQMSNESAAAYSAGKLVVPAGNSDKVFDIGVRHSF